MDAIIYPSPSEGQVFIQVDNVDQDLIIEVYDLLGKKMEEVLTRESYITIDMGHYSGIYFIKVKSGDRQIMIKIIIQQ